MSTVLIGREIGRAVWREEAKVFSATVLSILATAGLSEEELILPGTPTPGTRTMPAQSRKHPETNPKTCSAMETGRTVFAILSYFYEKKIA